MRIFKMIEHIKTWSFLCSLTLKAKCFCVPFYNKNKTIGKAYFYWKKKNSMVKYYLPTKALPMFVVHVADHKNIGGDQHFTNPSATTIVKILKSLNGKTHRKDGPAHEFPNGNKHWYLNGMFHREDGPALDYVSGDKQWFFNDMPLNENKIQQLLDLGYPIKTAIKLVYFTMEKNK